MKARKKSGKNKKVIFIALGVILFVAVGALIGWKSGVFKENDTEININNSNNENKEEEPEKKLQIVDENTTLRPYAVMINNISTARPLQSGLQDAYIIYEMIVEGGITRYMALFLDQNTERIGSIRSARHLVDNTKTGWRDNSLKVATEHRLFTSIEKLNSGLGKIRATRNNDLLLNYSIDELDLSKMENAQSAQSVSIKYSSSTTSSYEYDSENQVYKRFVNDKAHTDYVTKEQYTFKNIITYQVGNYTINDGENKGRQELENIGSGTGYFISNGYAVPIKWEKDSRASQTKYYFENGEELIVNDGNTFIQIQPKGQKLVIE